MITDYKEARDYFIYVMSPAEVSEEQQLERVAAFDAGAYIAVDTFLYGNKEEKRAFIAEIIAIAEQYMKVDDDEK